jgi:hypothetical protein
LEEEEEDVRAMNTIEPTNGVRHCGEATWHHPSVRSPPRAARGGTRRQYLAHVSVARGAGGRFCRCRGVPQHSSEDIRTELEWLKTAKRATEREPTA